MKKELGKALEEGVDVEVSDEDAVDVFEDKEEVVDVAENDKEGVDDEEIVPEILVERVEVADLDELCVAPDDLVKVGSAVIV